MFETSTFISTYKYVKNRIVIPQKLPLKEVYNYISEQLQVQYKEEFLGFYAVWDTKSAARKHNATTIPFASGKIDFYLHIYVFRDGREKPLYAQAQFSYAFAENLPSPLTNVHYRLSERAIGSRILKELTVVDAPTFLHTSLLATISLGKVYTREVFEGRRFSMALPPVDDEFDISTAKQMTEIIRKLNLTDGISISPFAIINTVETHSMKAFNQAFLLAKLVGGIRKLNYWTTRMHRSQTKHFNELYKSVYPKAFQSFHTKNQEHVAVITTLSGAYLPVENMIVCSVGSEAHVSFLLFNPFTSIRLDVIDTEITTHVVRKLRNQSLEELMELWEQNEYKEQLSTSLITA